MPFVTKFTKIAIDLSDKNDSVMRAINNIPEWKEYVENEYKETVIKENKSLGKDSVKNDDPFVSTLDNINGEINDKDEESYNKKYCCILYFREEKEEVVKLVLPSKKEQAEALRRKRKSKGNIQDV